MLATKILPYQKSGSIYKVNILQVFFTQGGVEFLKVFSIVFQVLLLRVFLFLLPSQLWH